MPTVLATEIISDQLTIVEAKIHSNGRTSIQGIYNVPLPEVSSIPEETQPPQTSSPDETIQDDNFVLTDDSTPNEPVDILSEIKKQIPECDYSVGIIRSSTIISSIISLPFDDKKKIEQVAPVQLQDVLPFDPDGFILNNQVLGKNRDDEFDILSTIIPQTDLLDNIALYNTIGLNPKILTTKASALIPLKTLFTEELNGTFILLAFSANCCSVVSYINDQLKVCRDLPFDPNNPSSCNSLSTSIRMITAKVLRDETISYQICYTIGSPFDQFQLTNLLGVESKALCFADIFDYSIEDPKALDSYAWAAGLLLYESQKKKSNEIINFRKGPFAFEPLLEKFIAAIKDEASYFIVTALVLLIWTSGLIYFKNSKLEAINTAITDKISAGLPGEAITPGQETTVLNDKILDLKQQLGTLGSLSSTATIDALKNLSTAIGPSVGIKIDILTISHSKTDAQSKLTIDGSVADIPKAGILQEALKKQKQVFCKVDFQSKGQVSGSSRVGFSTTISLCD